jgi:hypothetical protein
MERPDETTEEKALNLDIHNLSEEAMDKYSRLLLAEQVSGAKENGGKTITVSVEKRRSLLDQAKQSGPVAEPYSNTNANAQVPSSHKEVTYKEDPYWTK